MKIIEKIKKFTKKQKIILLSVFLVIISIVATFTIFFKSNERIEQHEILPDNDTPLRLEVNGNGIMIDNIKSNFIDDTIYRKLSIASEDNNYIMNYKFINGSNCKLFLECDLNENNELELFCFQSFSRPIIITITNGKYYSEITCDYIKQIDNISSYNEGDGINKNLYYSLSTLSENKKDHSLQVKYSNYTIDKEYLIRPNNISFEMIECNIELPEYWEYFYGKKQLEEVLEFSYNYPTHELPTISTLITNVDIIDENLIYHWYHNNAQFLFNVSVEIEVIGCNKTFHIESFKWIFDLCSYYEEKQIDELKIYVTNINMEEIAIVF